MSARNAAVVQLMVGAFPDGEHGIGEQEMKRVDFEHGTVTGNILGAALPMLVAQILNLLYNVVDRIYIARIPGEGTAALGGVGLCFPLIVIITAFSNLFGTGGAPLFAIERGKKDAKKAARIMSTSFSMLCGCGGILMVLGWLFAHPLLKLFGASENAMRYAYPYLMMYLIGTLPSMIAVGMNPFINAQGYSLIGMLSVAIGALANLLLDPLFIFSLGLGVRGAAIATVLSQCLSACVTFFSERRSGGFVPFGQRSGRRPPSTLETLSAWARPDLSCSSRTVS